MSCENAVRPLRFERDDRNIPRTGTVGRRNAATRQPFQRFELEDGAGRPERAAERCRWDCHTVTSRSPPVSTVGAASVCAILTPAITLDRHALALVPGPREIPQKQTFAGNGARTGTFRAVDHLRLQRAG